MSLFDRIGDKHVSLIACGLLMALVSGNSILANPSTAPATATAPAKAQTQPASTQPAGPPPKFRCDQKEFDFGSAWATEKVEHSWTIHNEGKGELTIEAKPTCGCTVASYDKKIKPGGEGKVTAVLTTGNYTGDAHKAINVTTNDTTQPTVSLALKGKIKQKIISDPPLAAYFGQMAPGINLTKTFKLTNGTDKPMKIEVSSSGEPSCFKVAVKEIEPGKVAELTVTAEEPLKEGTNHAVFTVRSGLEGVPDMSFPCNITKPPIIEITPTVIRLPSMPPPTVFRQVVNYRNNGKSPVKVISAVCDDERIKTKVSENAPGVLYTITVEIPKDYDPQPSKLPMLAITTDRKESPVDKIPFLASRTPRHKAAASQPSTITPESLLGRPAPSASPNTLDGRQVRIGSGSDKIMVINFWASWCTPSLTQIARLDTLYQSFRRRGVEFVNISVDQLRPKDEITQVAQTLKSTIPVALDPNLAIAKQYGVNQFPTVFLVGRNGTVESVRRGIGRMPAETEDMLEAMKLQIETLLDGKTREQFPMRPQLIGFNCNIENASPTNNLLAYGGLYIESLRQEAGLFKPKTQGSYKVYFRNNSMQPIRINSITGDEVVKVASDFPKLLGPGSSGFVNCTFETPAKAQLFSGAVAIVSSDSNRPKVTVTVTGQTKPFVEVDPAHGVDFGYKPKTFVVPRLVTLTYNGDGKIEYAKPESDNPKFEAEVQVRQPNLALLTIKTLPPFSPGMAKATIKIKTNQPEQPAVVVPVRLYMPNRLEVVPPSAAIGLSRPTEPLSVSLINTGTKPVKIVNIQPSRPEIKTESTLEPDKLSYRIQISFPENFRPSYVGDRITITTDDPEFKEFVVPIVRGSAAMSNGLGHSRRH